MIIIILGILTIVAIRILWACLQGFESWIRTTWPSEQRKKEIEADTKWKKKYDAMSPRKQDDYWRLIGGLGD